MTHRIKVFTTPITSVWRAKSPFPAHVVADLVRLSLLRDQILRNASHQKAIQLATDIAKKPYTTETNAIAGSTYKLHQTIAAVKEKKQSGSEQQYYDAIGHENAIDLVERQCLADEPPTESFICSLHEALMAHPSQRVDAGAYRTCNYWHTNAGGVHVYPDSDEVPREMSRIAAKFREFWTMTPTDPIVIH